MSTTINVYPTTDVLPLVEQTRARTQELFQEALHSHAVYSIVEVKAFHPAPKREKVRPVSLDACWAPGLHLGFGYWIDGRWDSSSWPSCFAREDDDDITEEDAEDYPDHVGQWYAVAELAGVLDAETQQLINGRQHYWSEYRNFGGPAVASTGYGLVAAALAEATGGVIASFDHAFAQEHNGETAAQFIGWWLERQLGRYGLDPFR